jgi:hypothetical protein
MKSMTKGRIFRTVFVFGETKDRLANVKEDTNVNFSGCTIADNAIRRTGSTPEIRKEAGCPLGPSHHCLQLHKPP